MKRFALLSTLAAVATSMVGCAAGVLDWRNHASFRTAGTGSEVRIAQIEPDEPVRAVISQNLHYVAISLDAVFFRDLPGIRDRSVALGVEVDGILPDRKVKGVIDVKEAVSKHAFLRFDNALVFEPFLYAGRPITITLHFRAVAKDDLALVRESTLSRLGAKLDPLKSSVVNMAAEKFTQVLGALTGREKSWTYSFTLFPADTTYRDKPEMLFTATRHILLAVPPVDAPKAIREKLNPYALINRLRMRGNRLIDGATGDEFTDAPYIVLNVTRFKRYPKDDTPLAQSVKQVERWFDEGNLEMIPTMLRTINVEIANDKILTTREKNLERARNEIRELTVKEKVAERDVLKREEAMKRNVHDHLPKIEKRLAAIEKEKARLIDAISRVDAKQSHGERARSVAENTAKIAALAAEEHKLHSERDAMQVANESLWEEVATLRTRQLKLLSGLLTEHAPILEPYEIEETDGKIRRLAQRTETLFSKLSRDFSEIRAIVADLDHRVKEIKKENQGQSDEIKRLKETQVAFAKEMTERVRKMMDDREKNAPRAIHKAKWFEKPWVVSLITVGAVGVAAPIIYLLAKPSSVDTTPSARMPTQGQGSLFVRP